MQIRLGTLNAWAMPEPLSRDLDARIDAIGAKLASLDLDVIAFQEAWTSDARRSLRRAGASAGLQHSWGHDQGNAGGLLVLSRFPISDVHFETFALRGEPSLAVANLEYLSGKGFVTLRIESPDDGPFNLINTHLHARYKSVSGDGNLPHRIGQVVQLATNVLGIDIPAIAVGDFNFLEGELDYRVFTDVLHMRDTAAELGNRQPTTLRGPYRQKKRIDRRKDFVFVRDGETRAIESRSIRRTFDSLLEIDGRQIQYSNHAGLVFDFELGPRVTAHAALPDRSLFELTAQALARGQREAEARQETDRTLSGLGVGCSVIAGLGTMPQRMSRRRVLRFALGSAALLALTPSIGLGVASQLLVPKEIRAFRKAAKQLARLDPYKSAVALSS